GRREPKQVEERSGPAQRRFEVHEQKRLPSQARRAAAPAPRQGMKTAYTITIDQSPVTGVGSYKIFVTSENLEESNGGYYLGRLLEWAIEKIHQRHSEIEDQLRKGTDL